MPLNKETKTYTCEFFSDRVFSSMSSFLYIQACTLRNRVSIKWSSLFNGSGSLCIFLTSPSKEVRLDYVRQGWHPSQMGGICSRGRKTFPFTSVCLLFSLKKKICALEERDRQRAASSFRFWNSSSETRNKRLADQVKRQFLCHFWLSSYRRLKKTKTFFFFAKILLFVFILIASVFVHFCFYCFSFLTRSLSCLSDTVGF